VTSNTDCQSKNIMSCKTIIEIESTDLVRLF